jgi:magnesium transporter
MTRQREPADLLALAARQATRSVPIAASDESVDAVLAAMRGHRFDCASVVIVCDHDRVAGLASVERLLAAPPRAAVGQIMNDTPATVTICGHAGAVCVEQASS